MTLAVYAVFYRLADHTARPHASPDQALTRNLRRPQVILPILATSVYRGCLGEELRRLATVGVQSYVEAGCLAAALLIAAIVALRGRNAAPTTADEDRPQITAIIGLVLAVTAGLTPLAFMGRWPPPSAIESRFWAPVVPFAVCAFSALAARLLRPRWIRYWPVLCAFLATWVLATEETTLWRNRERGRRAQCRIRSHMPPSGFCVAIFEDSWIQGVDWLNNDGSVTAIISRDWPADEALRFWAFPILDMARFHGLSRYNDGEPLRDGMLRRKGQTFLREGKLSRILWVRMPTTGQVEIWPNDVTD